MYKIAFIVPTKDRPEALDECLDAMSKSFLKFNSAVYVMDGNDDNLSCQVCGKYTNWGGGIT